MHCRICFCTDTSTVKFAPDGFTDRLEYWLKGDTAEKVQSYYKIFSEGDKFKVFKVIRNNLLKT